jgi:hypothetical protein
MKRIPAVAIVALAALGIATAARAQSPTFSKDVAPILYKNCVVCHRAGEVAPMSLITYQNVRPWARAIKNKVVAREMPPWGAGPASMKLANDRSLSPQEIDTIVRWADGGGAKGDDADLPAVPTFPAGGWVWGQPDFVIDLPIEAQVPPTGEYPQLSYFVKSPFPTDVWMQGMQIRTNNPAIVHHATLFIRTLPDDVVLKDGKVVLAPGEGRTSANTEGGFNVLPPGAGPGLRLVSYTPGRGWERYADGVARRLPKGAYIEFNMHYQPSGKPEKERAQFGIWLSKVPVRHEMQNASSLDRGTTMVEGKPLGTERLPNIPPGVDNWKISNFKIFPQPATLYAMSPHMHLRGKDMRFIVTYPDGREEIVLDVPKYDFNWQLYYELATPLKLPAGSKLTAYAHYDNSAKNKWNPAPDKEVFWSEQSWDEMYNPQIRWTWDLQDVSKESTVTGGGQQ